MKLTGLMSVSSDVQGISEIVACVLIGAAALFLVGSGFRARRKTHGSKGSLRLVGGSALGVRLGFSIYGPVNSAAEKKPVASAKPTATATTPAPEEARVFENCDQARDEFDRLYDQLLDRGSQGDIAGMTSTAETQLQTTILNEACFSERGRNAVSEVLTRLKSDPAAGAAAARVPEACRPVLSNAVRLLETAKLRKLAGDGDGAARLGTGFARLSATNSTCMP